VVSSVTGYSQGYPTISQRNAETSVTVRDGQTFVIGGLTQRQATKTRSGIPVLGARLFDHETASTTKSDLYILITPHISRRGDGAP
jgi:general secretion pathway protein D